MRKDLRRKYERLCRYRENPMNPNEVEERARFLTLKMLLYAVYIKEVREFLEAAAELVELGKEEELVRRIMLPRKLRRRG